MSVSLETKIWASINDTRNQAVIDKENINIQNFIPKTTIAKDNTITDEEIVVTEQNIIDIISLDFTKQNVLEIIKNQSTVISYLGLIFRTNDMETITWPFYKKYLSWILESSIYITTTFNIPIYAIRTDEIIRSSYKFCTLKEKCTHTYGNPLGYSSDRSKQLYCSGDHYVHNKIIQDLTCLINVLDKHPDSLHDDLRVGLSTINFVIRHMYQELEIFYVYLKDTSGFNINDYYCHRGTEKKSNNKKLEVIKRKPPATTKSQTIKDVQNKNNTFAAFNNDSDSD